MDVKVTTINLDRTTEALKKFTPEELAPRVARAFAMTASQGRDAGARELDRGLSVKSRNYILKYGVKGMPLRTNQIKAFEKAFTKYGDAEGHVYIRGANTVKKSLDFLMDHEDGSDRFPTRGGLLAVPTGTLKSLKYRTGTGKVYSRYKPENLLSDYNDNAGKRKVKSRAGSSFIARRKGKKGKIRYFVLDVERRKAPRPSRKSRTFSNSEDKHPLQLMYQFRSSVDETKKISFGDRVEETILNNLEKNIAAMIYNMKL